MLVELVGLPTSGKSTLVGPLIKRLGREGIKAAHLANVSRKYMEEDRPNNRFTRHRIERTSLFGSVCFGNRNPEIYRRISLKNSWLNEV